MRIKADSIFLNNLLNNFFLEDIKSYTFSIDKDLNLFCFFELCKEFKQVLKIIYKLKKKKCEDFHINFIVDDMFIKSTLDSILKTVSWNVSFETLLIEEESRKVFKKNKVELNVYFLKVSHSNFKYKFVNNLNIIFNSNTNFLQNKSGIYCIHSNSYNLKKIIVITAFFNSLFTKHYASSFKI